MAINDALIRKYVNRVANLSAVNAENGSLNSQYQESKHKTLEQNM